MTTGYLLEFEDESNKPDYVPNIQVGGSLTLFPDAATRIAIALERIAAALERAYPVGTEEGQGDE